MVIGAGGEDADAVVLDLEEPRRIGGGLVDERGEHQELPTRRELGARRPELGQALAQRLDPSRAVAQLLHCEAREHRLGEALGQLGLAGVRVGLFQ